MKPTAYIRIGLVMAICGQGGAASLRSADDIQAIVDGNAKFAFALYREVASVESGNVLVSPWSVSCALVAAQVGADGATASEISKATFLSASPDGLRRGFGQLNQRLDALQAQADLTIRQATAIWCHSKQPLREDFVQFCVDTLRAKVLDSNFHSQAINEWVSTQTMGKIQGFQDLELHGFSRLVIVNALYFKGPWERQFARESTRSGRFTLASGHTVDVKMMHGQHSAGYGFYDGVQVLQLPYKGGGMVMFLILPMESSRLGSIERGLSVDWFAGCRRSLRLTKVDVSLPAFTMSRGLKLNAALQHLGMVKAFSDDDADFSGIDGCRTNLLIDAVFQKVYVDVNEQGTEAAVATGTGWRTRSSEIVEQFVCDRPFIFVIYAARAGTILFLGRVNNPTESTVASRGPGR